VDQFRRGFETSAGELLVSDEPPAEVTEADVAQETIVRHAPAAEKK
jgi:hypothetical protein